LEEVTEPLMTVASDLDSVFNEVATDCSSTVADSVLQIQIGTFVLVRDCGPKPSGGGRDSK
jgi:hypothetical protein